MVFFKTTGLRRGLHARTLRGIYRSILILLIAVSFIFLGHESFAADTSRKYQIVAGSDDKVYLKDDISKILSVLEKKTGDQKLVEKAKDKLFTLSEGKIRLISSLCERISHDSYSADADIAFLLITTLIIFS